MRNSAVNHSALKAAQSKAVIARYLGDGRMWQEAHEAMKTAINMPWYRKS
ncbi:host cell division inhibitory peptide Kil [Candidatus Erwinia dacicola]|uniref:Bacteriophage lambda Kil family protein n=1 Tax=Candidatus Erwinia dacicola TaxID=252393 RepID=A0A328TV25_9GAMM|nr:host cell division inhibitory peptide Kil [Candidatus Erwinia dacicola]RAP72971.1 bacteriophage lambda Kil family protein [Candidatus Erwinia dacicola]